MKKNPFLSLSILCLLCAIRCYSIPLHPEYTLTIEANRYIIDFTLPQYQIRYEQDDDAEEAASDIQWRNMQDSDCPPFCHIDMEGMCDYTDEPTYPELPFFSLELLLPDDATAVHTTLITNTIAQETFHEYVQPAVSGAIVDSYGHSINLDTVCFNTAYYTNGCDATYPNGFFRQYYEISNLYTFMNSKGVSLSIHPFSYYPNHSYANVLTSGRFIVDFDGSNVNSKIDELQNDSSTASVISQLYFSTFGNNQIAQTEHNPKYLIVAARTDMEHSLYPYVQYKQMQGYDVRTVYLDQDNMLATGGQQLANYINYSNHEMQLPDYVLLVGNLTDIPAYSGSLNMLDPYTDDPYHPLLGRWIVGSQDGNYPEIDTIINKTISTEVGYMSTPTTAALFSGVDDTRLLSRWMYNDMDYIAENVFQPLGLSSPLTDGRETSTNFFTMRSKIQSQPHFFIYSGHGKVPETGDYLSHPLSGLGTPYDLVPTNNIGLNLFHISSLNNNAPLPMGFGFACRLNTYIIDNNFGARWIAEQYGGVTFYGATTDSRFTPDRYLSRRIFNVYKELSCKLQNFPITWMTYIGEFRYFNAFISHTREHQVMKYNLLGDPTLYVYGRNGNGTVATFHLPKKDDKEADFEQQETIILYDISGRKIGEYHNSADIPEGIYIMNQQKNGQSRFVKILKK